MSIDEQPVVEFEPFMKVPLVEVRRSFSKPGGKCHLGLWQQWQTQFIDTGCGGCLVQGLQRAIFEVQADFEVQAVKSWSFDCCRPLR